MNIDRATISALILESLLAPRQAARKILSLGGGYRLALPAFGFVVAASVIASSLLSRVTPSSGNAEMDYLISQPLLLAAMQGLGTGLFSAVVVGLGRLMGGRGRLDQVILMLAWLDFLFLVLQFGMLVVLFAVPALASPVVLFAGAVALWVMASFIAEVHGFKSTGSTLAVLIGGLFFVGIALALISPLT